LPLLLTHFNLRRFSLCNFKDFVNGAKNSFVPDRSSSGGLRFGGGAVQNIWVGLGARKNLPAPFRAKML